MNFSEQIKKIRSERNLTQQEMANKIGISRQAISNWENDKNLPDIEMIIIIAKTFDLTLDELILGGTNMNNITQKLIDDGSENKKIKMKLTGIKIGFILVGLAFFTLILGIFVPVQMENHIVFLYYVLLFCGIISFFVVGIKSIINIIFRRIKKQ